MKKRGPQRHRSPARRGHREKAYSRASRACCGPLSRRASPPLFSERWREDLLSAWVGSENAESARSFSLRTRPGVDQLCSTVWIKNKGWSFQSCWGLGLMSSRCPHVNSRSLLCSSSGRTCLAALALVSLTGGLMGVTGGLR